MMGLEEHLLGMFRGDFEFNDEAAPSHLGAAASAPAGTAATPTPDEAPVTSGPAWELAAEQELRKIPFFVRGKARRNTELFARERGMPVISLETLYEAKAHFSR
jgi:light-independent protochlorophyllide reductase subunit B